jgi:hypothetical protein
LEMLLSKLMASRSKASIQIVAMSATMSGLDSLSSWLDAQLFLTNFRPVPLTEHAVFEGTVYAKANLPQLQCGGGCWGYRFARKGPVGGSVLGRGALFHIYCKLRPVLLTEHAVFEGTVYAKTNLSQLQSGVGCWGCRPSKIGPVGGLCWAGAHCCTIIANSGLCR